ncbi:hypothetical protein K5X80_14470 [Caenibius sp. WL]|nr:hypothetical protein K5X80_14470 [Caenibius sp. WL]
MALTVAPALASAADAPAAAADAPAAAAVRAAKYTTADTTIGDLLDDPAAKAIVEKAVPGFTSQGQIEMARGMTLRAIQAFAPDDLTDERLNQIDAELAKLPQ